MKSYLALLSLLTYALLIPSSLAETGAHRYRLDSDGLLDTARTDIAAIAFSPDATRLAVATDAGVTVYDTYTGGDTDRGGERVHLPSVAADITALAFSSDNRVAFASATEATLSLWNLTTGAVSTARIRDIGPLVTLAFSPDGGSLAGGGFSAVHLWQVTAHRLTRIAHLRGHRDMVTTLAFTPDGETLASSGATGPIFLWDVRTAHRRRTLFTQTGSVMALAFAADSRTLASGGYWDVEGEGTLAVWDTHTGHRVSAVAGHTHPVFTLLFIPDGTQTDSPRGTLATVGWDNAVRLWEPRTGQLQARWDGETAPILSLAVLPPTERNRTALLATVGIDGTVALRPLTAAPAPLPADVNTDGVVDILDATLIVSRFGQESPDLTADGVVDILDLVYVVHRFGQ